MIILLMTTLAIPVKMTLFPAKKREPQDGSLDQLVSDNDLTHLDPLLTPSSSAVCLWSSNENEYASDIEILLAEGEGAVRNKRRPKRREESKFHEAIIKADFWLLWFVYFLGVGSGVTVLNNLAQIGVAQGVNDTTILLAVFSFCNFIGRLGAGIVSEHVVRSFQVWRFHLLWSLLFQAHLSGFGRRLLIRNLLEYNFDS